MIRDIKTTLSIDQDFADAAETVKFLQKGEKQLKDSKKAALEQEQDDYGFLFADWRELIQKPVEVLTATINARITEHKESEAKRQEAERERIRQEEEAKAKAEAERKEREETPPLALDEQAIQAHSPSPSPSPSEPGYRPALDELGIRWKVNAAGDLLVGRRHVDEVFCGRAEGAHSSTRKAPNFGALSA